MTEIPNGVESLRVELPLFDINTSQQDILTRRSGFNPFPEKAYKGMSVWSMQHPTTNPLCTIRYEGGGEMYDTHIPVSYPDSEIKSPQPIVKAPEPFYGANGEQFGHWLSMDEFMFQVSRDVVEQEEAKGQVEPLINQAVVKRFTEFDDGTRWPIFETPGDAFAKILRSASEAVANGHWREAGALVDYGYRVGAYDIDGQRYSSEASEVFEYSGRQFALDAVPSLYQDVPNAANDRGRWDLVSETSSKLRSYIHQGIEERALQSALQEFQGNAAAVDHINRNLGIIRQTKALSEEFLQQHKSVKGETSYLDQAKQYLTANNIVV